MPKHVTLLALLLTATVASADMPLPPWQKRVPTDVVLEFAGPFEGYTLFSVCGAEVNRIPTTGMDEAPRIEGGGYRHRFNHVQLVAVTDAELAKWTPKDRSGPGAPLPSPEWFRDKSRVGLVTSDWFGPLSRDTTVNDPAVRSEARYRVELTPTGIRLELLEEKTVRNDSFLTCSMVTAGITAAIIALGGYLLVRRKSFGRSRSSGSEGPRGPTPNGR